MELLARWIGIFVITIFLMIMPALFALSFALHWNDAIMKVLCIICFCEFIALATYIAKSVFKE